MLLQPPGKVAACQLFPPMALPVEPLGAILAVVTPSMTTNVSVALPA